MYELEKNYGLIDLHLHLDGSLSISTVRELAQMQGIEIPENEGELRRLLQVNEDCKDLNEYLEKFSFPCALLQTKEAITKAVANLQEELKAQGLLYAEIRFAPQLHTLQGLSQEGVVEAAIAGLKLSDFKANLILCCMRGDHNHTQNIETVQAAAQYFGKGVCAVDLAGAEALYPTSNFGDLFQLAKEKGLPYTIHAGEADGPGSIRAGLKLGANRLGHGIRSAEDAALVERLAGEGITLELCPTSNLNTNIFSDIHDYPLPQLMEAGVKVTINTDNMTVSGVSLRSEMEKVISAFSLTKEQIRCLIQNAADASFASSLTKQWLNCEIDSMFRQ